MTNVFDFFALQRICANWPYAVIPQEQAATNLFERIRQILLSIRDGNENLAVDLAPLLRQAILLQKHRGQQSDLIVPLGAGWPSSDTWSVARCTCWVNNGVGHIDAQLPQLAWLGEAANLFDDAYHEVSSRPDYRVPMDPFMEKATMLNEYLSRGQREALRAMFQLPAGVTLLANLPTGSGKSLLGQASALVQGGLGKITLVIVPTVALAIDQMRRMEKMLRMLDPDWEGPPLAYHGGVGQQDRARIRRAIIDGSQRILFVSPESVTGSLRRPIETAARSGYIRTIVIDEAHLVVGWGDDFRPAFQLLPAMVRALRQLSTTQPLRTVLASATLTANTVQVLQTLFGPPSNTYMVSGVHLRSEPRYGSYEAATAAERTRLTLEAVYAAPRPFILYVTERSDAKTWHTLLADHGYQRIALFHGGTDDRERERILKDWANNAIDGVVATSAFGLGVDKSDVRAVIHATLPESLDRFYQEVGRGGRDGHACASLLLFEAQDIPLARSIASPTLIGNDYGFERWDMMLSKAKQDDGDRERHWLDITLRPPHLKQDSDTNLAWNLRTLTLMARAGLIEIHAIDAGVADADAPSVVDKLTRAAVRITHPGHRNSDVFNRALDKARSETFESSDRGIDLMVDVARHRHEMSAVLSQIYSLHMPGATVGVEACCAGCPRDWTERGRSPYYHDPVLCRIPRMQEADIDAWRGSWPMAADNILLIAFPPEQLRGKSPGELIGLLLDALPVHTVLLAERLVNQLLNSVRQQLRDRWSRPVFLDRYTRNTDDVLYGAKSEVRIVVADPSDPLPQVLWLSECALQVVLVANDLPDLQHPLRRLLDTRAHINHEDFIARLVG
jgi:ATP-dependent DNA helicase RecQ